MLRLAVARDNDNPFAWYQLGIVYDREGDQARAALATAERYNLQGQPQLALPNAEQAMMGLRVGTPDYLRAQDIAMVSRTAVQQRRRNRNERTGRRPGAGRRLEVRPRRGACSASCSAPARCCSSTAISSAPTCSPIPR